MKVKLVETLFSKDTSDMLQELAKVQTNEKKILEANESWTLSFFSYRMSRWFSINQCTDTNDERCLVSSQKNHYGFLKDINEMISGLTFMKTRLEKDNIQTRPWQKGIVMLNSGLCSLADYMTKTYRILSIPAGNLTTDPIENFFSRIRLQFSNPSASQFHQAIKRVTLTAGSSVPLSKGRNVTSEDSRSFISSEQILNASSQASAMSVSLEEPWFEFVDGDTLPVGVKENVNLWSSGLILKLVRDCDDCETFFRQFKSSPYCPLSPPPTMLKLLVSVEASLDHNWNQLRNRDNSLVLFRNFIVNHLQSSFETV
jgi:hypothetical protein